MARLAPALTAPILLAFTGLAVAVPYEFSLDRLSLSTRATLADPLTEVLVDDYDDGLPPPSGPLGASSYFMDVGGVTTGMGPEDVGGDGRLRLRSSDAIVTPSLGGGSNLFQRARLLTNRDNANTTDGLKSAQGFEVNALFDLAGFLPGDRGENFGIRLEDFAPGGAGGDDVLALRVLKSLSSGNDFVTLHHFDFTPGASTPIELLGSAPLDPLHDQILLSFTKPDLGSSAVEGSFLYFDAGVADGGGPTTLGVGDIFHGENFTRVAIAAGDFQIPEPGSLALLGLGLAGFGLSRRRRR